MKFIRAAVLSVIALSCGFASASGRSGPAPFANSHPAGYPSALLAYGEEYTRVFTIGPEVAHMNLTESWTSASRRKVADDESRFSMGKLGYVAYLNNLCGGTKCTVTANIRVYSRHKELSPLIVRLTLSGSSSYMEAYMYDDHDGTSHVYSRSESGWIKKCDTPEAPDFKGILGAALNLVWEEKFRVR